MPDALPPLAVQIIECQEHEVISVPIEDLLVDGEITLDERIADRGYLDVSIKGGRLSLRSTRFVGLIPLNNRISIRVSPKAKIGNLSQMIVRCGEIPFVIPEFSRGYMPRFEVNAKAEETYHSSFLRAVSGITQRGLLKSYVEIPDPPPWRGRLLVSQTVNRHISKGIRYKGEFEFKTLSANVPENVAIKGGLIAVNAWLHKNNPKDRLCLRAGQLLDAFAGVDDWNGPVGKLMEDIPWRVNALPSHMAYYHEPLWTAYVLLQKMLPDVGSDGLVSLESMIVDVSKVFEVYARRVLEEAAPSVGVRVSDGNKRPSMFFIDSAQFSVHPDIILRQDGKVTAILDVKYKAAPKESDRYEMLSFLEATTARRAVFICPVTSPSDVSQYIGKTLGDREMSIIRINLAAENLTAEEAKFVRNVSRVLVGEYAFEQ